MNVITQNVGAFEQKSFHGFSNDNPTSGYIGLCRLGYYWIS